MQHSKLVTVKSIDHQRSPRPLHEPGVKFREDFVPSLRGLGRRTKSALSQSLPTSSQCVLGDGDLEVPLGAACRGETPSGLVGIFLR